VQHRPDVDKKVIATPEMSTRTGPSPLFRVLAKPCCKWIPLNVSNGRKHVLLIHDKRMQSLLPEMATPAFTKIDVAGITPAALTNC
jgi:hypothetical protein